MKVAIAADHGGIDLKELFKKTLTELQIEFEDFGAHSYESVDYPDYGVQVAKRVAAGEYDRGILICGTGIGMSIVANKIPGIRCAVVHDSFSAKATREHNDSNILAMGGRIVGPGLADDILRIWLKTEFLGGRHANRIGKITTIESKYGREEGIKGC